MSRDVHPTLTTGIPCGPRPGIGNCTHELAVSHGLQDQLPSCPFPLWRDKLRSLKREGTRPLPSQRKSESLVFFNQGNVGALGSAGPALVLRFAIFVAAASTPRILPLHIG